MPGVLYVTSESTVEPLSVEDVMGYLRISTDEVDDYPVIKSYITAARRQAEQFTGCGFVRRQCQYTFASFANGTAVVELPYSPLSASATDATVSYYTTAGYTTVNATAYTVEYRSNPGKVYPAYDNYWSDYDPIDVPTAWKVEYRCGYSASNIPQEVLLWMKYRIGAWYENREAVNVGLPGSIQEMPSAYVDGLLDQYRMTRV